ncbi:MAG: hypothetical protein ABI164_03840 [Acidobacteriaceae bacterium]
MSEFFLWSSVECVRYLRHMLVLEDVDTLRLMEGVTSNELAPESRWN